MAKRICKQCNKNYFGQYQCCSGCSTTNLCWRCIPKSKCYICKEHICQYREICYKNTCSSLFLTIKPLLERIEELEKTVEALKYQPFLERIEELEKTVEELRYQPPSEGVSNRRLRTY